MKFIKDAFGELEHVVWPTQKESKNYMLYTIGTIIIVGILLAVIGYGIRGGLSSIRSQFDHALPTTTASGEELVTEEELQKLQDELMKNKATSSGESLIPTEILETPTGEQTGGVN